MRFIIVTITIVLGVIAGSFAENTTAKMNKFMIGYDSGLSFRYFPKKKFGFGLVVQPRWGTNIYSNNEYENYNENYNRISVDKNRSKDKGATVLFDFVNKYSIGERFTLSPFASVGGSYLSGKDVRNYKSTSEDGIVYEDNVRREYKTKAFIGQVGVMPGVTFGPFSIEFRLGIKGSISKSEAPDDIQYRQDEENENFELIYPVDVVKSLVVHFGF